MNDLRTLASAISAQSLGGVVGVEAKAVRSRLDEAAAIIKKHLPLGRRTRLVEDLVAIAEADGHVHDKEIHSLCALGAMLDVPGVFVDESLGRATKELD